MKLRAGLSVPAVLFPPPAKGTLAVHLQSGNPMTSGNEGGPLRDGWRPIDVGDPSVLVAERHYPDPFTRRRRRARTITSVSITSSDEDGAVGLEGDGDLARVVAATAHRLDPGLVVVPSPFEGPAPGIYRRHSPEQKATARLALAGLVAVVHLDPSSRRWACAPMWGGVVPVGSEVHVTVGTAHEDEDDEDD